MIQTAGLRVRELRKEFDGLVAIDDLDFSIESGSISAIIGPNGAGKTTVLDIVTGLVRPDSGEVILDGEAITGIAPYKIARLGVARTFQETRLFPQLSVLDNMMLATRYRAGGGLMAALFRTRSMSYEEHLNREKAMHYLEVVGLAAQMDRLGNSLSHGQRRLLELARALATESRLLLLDEPVAGVFPETRGTIAAVLRGLTATGRTIVFIEHDIQAVMAISDHVIVLHYGRKIAEGPPSDVSLDESVIRAYLGRNPSNAP